MGTAMEPFLHIRLDDRGMHVTLAADRGRVPELGTDVYDGFTHAPQPRGSCRRRFPSLREDAGREDGADPGSKVLGGERAAADLAQVGVDVGRVDLWV